MKAKYYLGQKVILTQYDRWVGDYENEVIICGFENYVNNGVTVYQVKCGDQILHDIGEGQLKNET